MVELNKSIVPLSLHIFNLDYLGEMEELIYCILYICLAIGSFIRSVGLAVGSMLIHGEMSIL
tara:strand:+ start:460 stop:645 length:186 start_codon:yes stop_codon:yes gene_type:complete